MEIRLSMKLKSLRQKSETTQEELAGFLGISSQAVSKWERNEGYPDITLLPKIAGYFHVTVDELLGMDEITRQKRINEITDEYNRIRHHVPLDPNFRLDEGIELVRNAVRELPGEFFLEQLLAADLSWKGKNTTDETEKMRLFAEAIVLCEDILAHCVEDRFRDCAKQILIIVYAEMGETQKAYELTCQMPGPRCTHEYMLTYIQKGDALQNVYRLNAVLYYQIFRESVAKLSQGGIAAEAMVNEKELHVAGIDNSEYLAAINNVLYYQVSCVN